MDFLQNTLQTLPAMLVTLAISFTAHEYAHAYAAYRYGDPTAKNMGRLTLNPIPHIDPLGAIMLVLFGFGWAKPVPVNYNNMRGSRWAETVVSVVGPMTNLVLAFIGVFLVHLFIAFGIGSVLNGFFTIFIWTNIVLCLFNLIPLPPLDGFHIVRDLLPPKLKMSFYQVEKHGMFILMILVITPIGNFIFDPIFGTIAPWLLETMNNICQIIFGPFL